MKLVVIKFSIILFPSQLLSQGNPGFIFNSVDSTTVTGKIDGYSVNQEEQFINYFTYDIAGRQVKFSSPIQKDGNFNFKFLQQYKGEFGLQYGANFIIAYAQPGEKIEFKIDHNVADKEYHFPGAFKIEGPSSAISRHMLGFFAIYLPMMHERAAGFDFKISVDEFVEQQHRNLQKDLGLLNDYTRKNDPPVKFSNWARNWLIYEAAGMIVIKPFLGKPNSGMSDTLLTRYLRDIRIDNQGAMFNASYYQFLSRFVSGLQMIINNNTVYHWPSEQKESTQPISKALAKIDQYFQGILREIAYYENYSFNAYTEAMTARLDQVWNKFDDVIQDNFLQHLLEAKRNSSFTGFTPYNVIEKIRKLPFDSLVKKPLLEILEQEKGRYVYIDFWGSWCAPCMAEMPYYKAFIDELKDVPISFLFLAVETPLKDQKSAQEKFGIPGKFISLSKNDADIANEVFGFSSYPSHFLLDREGKLVTGKLAFSIQNKEDALAQIKWFIK